MPDIKFFKDAQGKVYEVPTSKLDRFKQKYPNATEATQDELNMLESKLADKNEQSRLNAKPSRVSIPRVPSVEMPTAQDVQIGTSEHTNLPVTGGLEQKGMQGAIETASQHHRLDPEIQFRAKYGAYTDNPELHRDEDAPELAERKRKKAWYEHIGAGGSAMGQYTTPQTPGEDYGETGHEDPTRTRLSQEYLERIDKQGKQQEIDKLSDFLTNTESGRDFVEYDEGITKYFQELKPVLDTQIEELDAEIRRKATERQKITQRGVPGTRYGVNPSWLTEDEREKIRIGKEKDAEEADKIATRDDIRVATETLNQLKMMRDAVNDRDKNAFTQLLNEGWRRLPETSLEAVTLGLKNVADILEDKKTGELTKKADDLFAQHSEMIENLYEHPTTMAQDIANGTLHSMAFMAGMAFTGVPASAIISGTTKGVGKVLLKESTNQFLKQSAKKGVGKVVNIAGKNIGEAFVQTVIMPSTWAGALEKNREEPGSFLNAYAKNFIAAFGEVGLERAGDFMPFKFKSKFMQGVTRYTHMNSFLPEIIEEDLQTAWHALFKTGEGEWSDLIDPRNRLVTAATIGLMQAPAVSIETAGGYAAGKHRNARAQRQIRIGLDKNIANMQNVFGDKATQIMEELNDNVEKNLTKRGGDTYKLPQLDKIETPTNNMTEDQKDAMATYTMAYGAKRGLERAKAESKISVANRVKSLVNEHVNKHTGTIIMADVAGMDSPVPIHGNIQFKPDGTIDHNKSGELYYKDADGKQKVTSSKYITLAETVDPAQIENDLAAQKEFEVEKDFANRQVRPYQNGEQVKFTDDTGTVAMYGQVTGVDENGNYIVSTQTGQTIVEPRQIVPETHLEGIENGTEVKYTNEKGETVEGTVTDAYSMRNNGMMVIDGQEVSTDNIIGVVETKQYQPGQTISFTVPNAEGGTDTKTGTIVSINKDGRYEVKAEGQEQQMVVDPKFVDGEVVVAPKTEVETEQTDIEAKAQEIEDRRKEELEGIRRKHINRRVQDLKEAKSAKDIAQAIIHIENNVRKGAVLTQDESAFVEQKKQELKDNGFEIVDLTNNVFKIGMRPSIENVTELEATQNLTQEQIDVVEKELELRERKKERLREKGLTEREINDSLDDTIDVIGIMTTVRPQLNKDGKIVQSAKVDILQIKINGINELLERSKQNPSNPLQQKRDEINAKYDAEIAALKGESVKTPEQLEAEKQQLAEQTRQQQAELEKKEFYDTLPRKQSGKDKGGLNHNQFTPEQKLKFVEFEYGKERAIAGAEVEVKNAEKRLKTAQTQLNNDPLNAAKIEAEIKAKEELDFYKSYVYEARRQQTEENKKASTSSIAEEVSKREQSRAEQEEAQKQSQAESEATKGVPDVRFDTPQAARNRGFRMVNGVKHERQLPINVETYTQAERKFSDKDVVPVKRTIVEAETLNPSHRNGVANNNFFITEAQPKRRTDGASQAAAESIATNINPSEITGGVTAYTGAPIVNAHGEVLQGNNRVSGLQLMHADGNKANATKYKQHLIDNAADYGMTPKQIEAMSNPVAVDMAEVNDAEAIRLGQLSAQDTESGGAQRIPAQQTAKLLGKDIDGFVERLFLGGNDNTPISTLLDATGKRALDYLNRKGVINATQYQSALNKDGNLTPEAKTDLQNIAAQLLYQKAGSDIEVMFMNLPDKAQKAILQTIHRDGSSVEGERIVKDIQEAIQAYNELDKVPNFAEAKNYISAKEAAMGAVKQTAMFDSETTQPLTRFSNFAIELAVRFKTDNQNTLKARFNALYNDIQGIKTDAFDTSGKTSRVEAINKHFKPQDYVSDGQTKRTDVAGDSRTSQKGQQTEPGRTTTGESVEGEKRSTDSTGRVESDNDVKEKQKTVERISKQLNTEVIVYNTPDDIPSNKKDAYLEKKKASKGWYIGNKVYVVLSNHTNALDVQETLLHEIVGHKGIKDMLGREKHEQLLTKIFDVLPKEVQAELNEKYKGDKYLAADEYIAKLAENYDNLSPQDKTIWEKVKQVIINFIENDLGIKLTEQNVDDVINALLVESKNRLENPAQVEAEMKPKPSNKLTIFNRYGKDISRLYEIFASNIGEASIDLDKITSIYEGILKADKIEKNSIQAFGEALHYYNQFVIEDGWNDMQNAIADAKNNREASNIKQTLDRMVYVGMDVPAHILKQVHSEQTKTKSDYGSQNKIITQEQYTELRDKLRNKLNNLNTGFDPEIFSLGAQMAAYHIEAGAVKFKDFAERMIADIGESVKPYLKSFYEGARLTPGFEQLGKQMDAHKDVVSADVDAIGKVQAELEKAKADVDTNPTEAQKEAGNYKKGHVTIAGLDITIENPKGSQRSGTDANGDAWSITMQNDYGYIKQTKGKDGDHIDIFIGDNLSSDKVFVVDQVDSKGNFDEHKVMLGFDTMEQAREAYLSNYEDGWTGLKDITETTVEDFKKWTDVDTKKQKAFAEYKQNEKQVIPPKSETNTSLAFNEWKYDTRDTFEGRDVNIRPYRVGQKFTDAQMKEIKEWAEANGLIFGVQSKNTVIRIYIPENIKNVRDAYNLIEDNSIEKIHKQKKADKEKVKQKANEARSSKAKRRPSYKWITENFGENTFHISNLEALQDYLEGHTPKFKGMINSKWAEPAQRLGIVVNGDQVDLKKLKSLYETEVSKPINIVELSKQAAEKEKTKQEKKKEAEEGKQKGADQSTPTLSQSEYESFDTRGYSYAIVKDGRVVSTGSSPIKGRSAIPIGQWLDQAKLYDGELFIAPTDKQALDAIDNEQLIMGMTWDQIVAAQQGKPIPSELKLKMPEGAKRYPSYLEYKFGTEKYEATKEAARGIGRSFDDYEKSVKYLQNAQEEFLKEKGMTQEQADKLPKDERKLLEKEAAEWLKKKKAAEATPEQPKLFEEQEQPKGKIEDFGEVIEGAKKHTYQRINVGEGDIKAQPLSKTFPKPDYKKLVEEGVLTKKGAMVLKHAYEAIPSKPRKKYRVAAWVKEVEKVIATYNDLIENKEKGDKLHDMLSKLDSFDSDYADFVEIQEAFGFPENDVNMGAYRVIAPNKTSTSTGINKQWLIVKGQYIVGKADSVEGIVRVFNQMVDKNKKKGVKLSIYRNGANYSIGRETGGGVIKLVEGMTREEAYSMMDNEQAKLQEMWEARKVKPEERRVSNRKRVGTDYRQGKDVTDTQFSETFGFRGVQFGNWVNNQERQDSLNDAYDALMDMANVLGVSPRALSLAGELGMAFGARGSGGKNAASAHYEPGRVVINLTKRQGAGSLAHEWWHAMDNYFSRMRGEKSKFLTESPKRRIIGGKDGKAVYESKVRKEMHDAFEGVIHAIYNTMLPKRSQELDKTRSKAYWATKLEMSARAFEGYIIDKLGETGEQNDYLANFKETGEWVSNSPFDMSTYPYPMKEEAATINEAYKNFFETIQEKQDGEDVILFREKQAEAIRFRESQDFRDGHGAPAMNYDTLQEAIDEGGDFNLSEIITGKQDLVPADYFDTRVATSKTGKQGYVGAIRYMYNTKAGTESLDAIKALREKVEDGANPAELKAKAYRAIPNTVDANKLIDGDWVSLSKDYVEKHGLARFGKGEYKIIEQDVPVNKLWWDGNDINELGYDVEENIRFRESDQIIEVTPFKYGEGGTKGTFKGEDGTVYKSLQGGFLDWEDGRSVRRYKDLDTQEYIILKMLEDDSRFPQVGERVETTEGAAFEIEELQKADNITFEEYLEVEKAIKELNSKGIYSNDFISVMRRPGTNEVVINDFSSGVYDASRIGNSYYNDVLFNRIEELLPEQEKAKLDKYKEDQRLELYKKLFPDEDIKREDIRFRQSDIPKLKEPFERVRANIENHISVKQNEFTNIDHDMSAEVKEKVLYGDIEDFGKYGRYEIVPVSNPLINIHNLNTSIYGLGVQLGDVNKLHSSDLMNFVDDTGYFDTKKLEKFSRDFNEAIKPYEEALLKAKHLSTEAAQTEIMHIIKDIDHARNYYERLAKDQSVLRTEEAPRFREGDQTQTKEFKEWFGDSKVVDSEGKPMVVYHGAKANHTAFNAAKMSWETRLSQQGAGFYFTNNRKQSQRYGETIETYLSIENPIVLDNKTEQNISRNQAVKLFEKGDYEWFFNENISFATGVDVSKMNKRGKAEVYVDYIIKRNKLEGTDKAILQNLKRAYNEKSYSEMMNNIKEVTGFDGAIEVINDATTVYVAYFPNQIKSATGNIGTFDATNEDIRFRVREDAPPKKTEKGYKVFFLKDGKLYPPMVANKGGVETPVGVWLDAEAPEVAGQTKTGRPQVKQGGKGTQGGSGRLAYRPGWHLGEIPYAEQFNRKNPQTGAKELFPAQFVWAEVEYANDVDYQKDAESYGYTEKGKYRHSYAGLPTLPKDGSYRYRTNPNPSTDAWIITGSMKVNRVLTPTEVDQIVKDAGREPQMRQEGALTDADIQSLNSEQPLFRSSEEIEATKQLRQEVDKVSWKFKTRLKEAWIDSFAQVKVLQDALKKNGLNIAEHNDYYLQATHIPGKVDARIEDYTNRYQKPLSKAIHDMQNKGVSHRNIENYVMLSEGLVRNERMRNEAIEQFEETNPTDAARAKFMENLPEDYSGVLVIEEEVGMSAQEFIDEIEQEAGKDVISNLWAKINAATHYTLQKQYEAGFITKAEMEHYMENKKYVPLRGHDDVTAEDVYNYPSSMGVYFENPIKRADGRVSRAESPFAYIGQMAHSAIIQGVKNQHNQMLLRLSRLDKSGLITNSRSWEVNVGTKEKPVWMVETAPFDSDIDTYIQNQVDFEERMRELQEQGMARQSGSKRVDVGGMFIKPRQAEQHEVTVFENGVRHTLYINANPAIARAINETNKWHVGETWGIIEQVLKVNRQMAANFTTRDVRFIFTNFARDINMASTLIWAEQGGKQMVGFNKNLKPAFGTVKRHFTGKADLNKKNDAYFREFLMNGGMTGYYQLYELDRQAKKLEREAKKGDKRNALDRGKSVFNAIDIMNEVVENTTRFAAYMTARESGKSVVQSVHAAKNVSVNFNQKGAGTSVSKNAFEKALFSAAGAVIPSYLFSNANIQGMYRIYQATKGSPLRMGAAFGAYTLAGLMAPRGTSYLSKGYIKAMQAAAGVAALSWIAPVLASLVGGDDGEEEYMKQGEYDRQNNFTLMLPSGSFLKYPISHEFRLWYKLGDHAYQLLTGHEDAERAATEMMYAVSDLLPANPLGAFDASPAELAPDFARPFAQLGTNTNFMGSSIYNEWANPDVPGYLNAKTNKKGEPYAPDILVNFLKSVDHETGGDGVVKGKVSPNPDKVHHLFRGFAGGLYTNIMQGISFGFEVYNAVNGEGFNLKAKDTPARAFYTSKDDLRFDSGTVNREYYDISRNASKTIGRANRYKKQYLEADINLQEYIEKIGKLDLTTANKQHEFIKEIKKMERQLPELQGKEQKDKELEIYQKKKELVELTK